MHGGQVLVTGGTGFIGRHLVRHLRAKGDQVRVLCRQPEKARHLFQDGEIELVSGDLTHPDEVRAAAKGAGIIYHVGGRYAFGARARTQIESVNVGGTQAVLDAAWAEGAAKVVHVSSAGVLRGAGASGVLTEEDFPAASAWGEIYKSSKWKAEKLAIDYAARGLPVTIVNPTCPIGAEDTEPTPTGRMVLDFLLGKFPVVSHTGLNFLDVQDLAAGIRAAGERGAPGQRYILGGVNLWLREFLAVAARETGRTAPAWTVPWVVVLLAGAVGEAAGLLGLPGGDRVCLETALTARRQQFFNVTRAREELGWTAATPLPVSLRRAIAWFTAEHPELNSGSIDAKEGVASV